MAHLPQTDFTDQDFDGIRARIIASILARPELAGFDTSPGNPDIALLEAFAENQDKLSLLINNAVNEAFLVRARQRRSAIDHTAAIGYRMAGATAAVVTQRLTLARIYADDVTFPARTRFTTEDGSVSYELDAPLTIAAGDTVGQGAATEGRSITETFTAASAAAAPFGQRITLASSGTSTAADAAFLWGSEEVTVGSFTWQRVQDFLDSGASSRHYRVETDANERASVVFGDGINGVRPPEGSTISVVYRVGGGRRGRVRAARLTRLVGSFSTIVGETADATTTNPADSSGGDDRETIERARAAGPASLRATTRTVAREDFELHAMEVPGVARALCRTHNEDSGVGWLENRVYVVPTDVGTPDPTLLTAVETYLTTPSPEGRAKSAVDSVNPVAPQYSLQTVTAVLHPLADADTTGLAIAGIDAVRALFDPRATRVDSSEYVCNFGQPVHRSEIIAALQALPGVAWVELSSPASDAPLGSAVAFPKLNGTPGITVGS